MTSDEFRSRMNNDVNSMLQWTNEIWSAERVIHNENHVMTMCHFSYCLEIQHITVWIAKSLGKHHLRVRLDGSFQSNQVVHLHNRVCDALSSKCVRDEVESTTIYIISSHDVVTSLHDVLQCISDGSSTTSNRKTCHTAFESSHTVLENALGGIGEATVDITCIAQTEAVGSMLRVMEHV